MQHHLTLHVYGAASMEGWLVICTRRICKYFMKLNLLNGLFILRAQHMCVCVCFAYTNVYNLIPLYARRRAHFQSIFKLINYCALVQRKFRAYVKSRRRVKAYTHIWLTHTHNLQRQKSLPITNVALTIINICGHFCYTHTYKHTLIIIKTCTRGSV